MSERTAEESRKVRERMKREDILKNEADLLNLLDLAYEKREGLKYELSVTNPYSRGFRKISYGISACNMLIREIQEADSLPFLMEPEEILNMYAERMSRFMKETPKKEYAYRFRVAEATAVNLKKKWGERREMECIRSNASKPGGTGGSTAT